MQRRTREKFLNETLFVELHNTRAKIPTWVGDDNSERPHSSLKYQTSSSHAATFTATDAGPRPAPPIARCSILAARPAKGPASNYNWMKVGWQVKLRVDGVAQSEDQLTTKSKCNR